MITLALFLVAMICWAWCFVLWAYTEPYEAGSMVAKIILACVKMVCVMAATLCSFWFFDLLIN